MRFIEMTLVKDEFVCTLTDHALEILQLDNVPPYSAYFTLKLVL
jgi:hypothetical protein